VTRNYVFFFAIDRWRLCKRNKAKYWLIAALQNMRNIANFEKATGA